jgi:hypothetical protein
MSLIRRIQAGGQVCASGGCSSSHECEPTAYRNANRAFLNIWISNVMWNLLGQLQESGGER